MRETGTVTLGMGAIGTVATAFEGTVHVHVKASLCGSPWNVNDVHRMFYPWRQQSKYAQRLFHSLPSKADALFQRLSHEMGGGHGGMGVRGVDEVGGFDDNYGNQLVAGPGSDDYNF